MRTGIYLVVALLTLGLSSHSYAEIKGQRALYLSGNQTLMGYIYRPNGAGPFPAIVFNQHAAVPLNQPGSTTPFSQLAKLFVSKGYIFFVPGRHNSGELSQKKNAPRVMESHEAFAVNIAAAVAWIKAQHDVDEKRIVVMGDTAGAASTLFVVNKLEARALVLFSPATRQLGKNYALQSRLKKGVKESAAPIFLIQVENDPNLLPKAILGPVLESKGTLNQLKVFPTYGETAADAQKFAVEGWAVWQRDVFAFLTQALN